MLRQSSHRRLKPPKSVWSVAVNLLKASLLVTALAAAPLAAQADSQIATGATPTASASLDFKIEIPRILFLQVGSKSSVDEVVFDLSGTPQAVGDRSAISGTGGIVTAKLIGNIGNVDLSVAGVGTGLVNGDGDEIPYDQITVKSSDNVNLDAPSLAAGGRATVPVDANGKKVLNREADWTYTYLNEAVVAPGTYTGTLTYTAAMP
jgi:hypothetical protein